MKKNKLDARINAARKLEEARQLAALLRQQIQAASETASALRGYGWLCWFEFKGADQNYAPTVTIRHMEVPEL